MRIENCFHVPSLSDVRLLGLPGETLARFAYERMESEAAWDVVYREAAEAFERKLDDASGVVGLWQGTGASWSSAPAATPSTAATRR